MAHLPIHFLGIHLPSQTGQSLTWFCMQDIRYAEKATPCVPHRVQKQQLKILVTGQPETGRTTAIKNLFASIVEDPDWCPTDVTGLTMDDFRATPERFTSVITDRKDTGGHLSISYIIQVRPQNPNHAQTVSASLAQHEPSTECCACPSRTAHTQQN
jgi:hypothetical protein